MSELHVGLKPLSRVAIVAPDASSVLGEYNGLAGAIRAMGDQVRCFAPGISREDSAELDKQGIHCTPFSMTPEKLSLLPRRRAIADLARLMGEWKPSVLVAIGELELVHAIRAAKKNKMGHIIAIPEIVPSFEGEKNGVRNPGAQLDDIIKAMNLAGSVVLLNNVAAAEFKEQNLLNAAVEVCVTPRCGVDLDAYDETPLPPLSDGLVFHLSSPLENRNGIMEFCEAAKCIKKEAPGASFVLSGPPGKTMGSVALDRLEPYKDVVEHAGLLMASKEALERCHVFVDLSREPAMPLVSMQALAMGRPVIAQHCPASHELVDERVNGSLVNHGRVDEIVEAMRSYLRRPDLIPAMARASRQKAVRRLSQKAALAKMLPLIYEHV